ncbi:hypothetical protein Q7P37_006997 [Cladosporium fusiforme]
MSSDGDDEPPSPSAFLEAPSSQSLIVDTQPFISQRDLPKNDSATRQSLSDSEDERDNRFPGPANTWRKYTTDERGLIASLDQERANDLSVHLYNAHALKTRLYDPDVASKARPWHSKRQWIKTEGDGITAWHPDQNWTAWPLRSDDVPRKSEGFGKDPLIDDIDDGTLKMRRPWRAGTDLEDEIQALMLRRARDRFAGRAWEEGAPSREPLSKRSQSASQMPSSPPVASRQSSIASDAHSQSSDVEIDQLIAKPSGKPTFLADDEEASRLMKQSVRHANSKLDDLLLGLQKSRHHQVAGSITPAELTMRSRSNKRKRRSTTNETAITEADANPDDVGSISYRKKRSDRDYSSHPSGQHGLNPRDWSEVLGMASLTGWDPAVIDRAAKRCAALFGERMSIKTMPERAAGKGADRVHEYHPQMIPDVDSSPEDMEDEDAEEGGTVGHAGFNCPEDSCPQRFRFYEMRWQIRQHLMYTHKYSREALDDYDQSHTPPDAKPSIERVGRDDGGEVTVVSKETPLAPAVETDGFMEPVDIFLGRGTDTKKRRLRSGRK